MQTPAERIWGATQEHLRSMLSADTYNLWFTPLRARAQENGTLVLEVADDFCAIWLKENYLGLLQKVVGLVSSQQLEIRFEVGASDPPDRLGEPKPGPIMPKVPEVAPERNTVRQDRPLRPQNKFDTFVVGNNNNFSYAAAVAVAQEPGKAYNPLFLHGGVGLGKTHLLHAIGHHVVTHRKGARVAYISSEQFTNEYIDGIVMSCDRPAGEIQNLQQRLVSRLEGGLVTDLQPPDMEMRLAILRKKAQIMGVELPEEIMSFLANRVRNNIRRLEGALNRVTSYAALTAEKLTVERVEGLLRDILHQEAPSSISIEVIQRKVAEQFDLGQADMTSKRRPENIAFPRQVAMFLSRQMTGTSLSAIGEAFGGRDHGTVLYACRSVKDRMETDPHVRQVVNNLEMRLSR